MGITYIDGVARGPTGIERYVHFLIDSGATYSLLPSFTWQEIGLEPKRQQSFRLTDGTVIQRSISECFVSLPQGDTHTPVILGEPGDEALLGVVTFEELGLVFHPFSRTLQPMRMMLA